MNTDPCKLSFNKWSKANTMLSLNPKSKLDANPEMLTTTKQIPEVE